MSPAARRAFVETLHAKRVALGLTQGVVGRRVGVHGNTVGKWELGRYWPTRELARAWASALGVRVVGGSLDSVFRPSVSPPPECGTPQGFRRHRRRSERCPECCAAWSAYICRLKKRGK